ncbi:MAG TPA: Clp protease N-terminal domain-containing protein [Abditibacterium sp.]|jgi:ATP-dependent Clp protease ATP-binding subunit ClpA
MWQRFTERSRRVILLAQEEARLMEAGEVRTEHLLLGLMREDEGVAAKILAKMGVKAASVRIEIAIESTPSQNLSEDEPLLTPKAKRVLELAADESRRFRHNYIGTEHLLLALLREKDGLAATVLQRLGFNLEEVRAQVMEYLSPTAASTAPEKTPDVTTDFLRGAVELAKNIGKNPDLAAVPDVPFDQADVLNAFFTPEATALLNQAAAHSKTERIGVEHLVLALLSEENAAILRRGLASGE